ncbi:AAA family ATPase [Tsukamurella sp. NPDC003166]|uniref:nSTAND1 domain-containing NTPase n=1 Tax=Tsukamurella sp. NPDC003166 TaxID=3154444 RepID=UPI0033ACC696
MASESNRPSRPDPGTVDSRAELGAVLRDLRDAAGLTVRELVEQADGYLGTVSGWLSGAHAPTAANRDLFDRVLTVCGVPESEFGAWWDAVARARVRSRTKAPTPLNSSPYRGFEAFEIADAKYFFGRDADADALRRRIDDIAAGRAPRHPVVVVGGSGIGKSSVVRAGLARAVDGAAGWDHVVITPGIEPMASIDEALAALRERSAPNPVLVIDQFEEIWTQGTGDDARAVLTRVLDLAAAPPVVVLVLRSDFLDRLVAQAGYAAVVGAGPVVIGPLDRTGLRAAITGPADRMSLTVEPGLVELLLDDAEATGDAAGVLPLLSHSLLTTWERSGRSRLTVEGYLETGRLAGAVEKTAEAVYDGLDEPGRATMHDLLLGLINVGADRVTRRITPAAELEMDADAEAVLDRLIESRLVTVGDDGVQLAHEALVQAWPRLSQWVDENRARLRLEHRIRVAAAHWTQAGEPPSLLLSSGMLDLIESLSVERPSRWGEAERRMIAQSAQRREDRLAGERRQVRKLRTVAITAAAFAVIAALAATMAWIGLANTARARDAAAQAHDESTSRQLALESRRLRPRDSALAAQLAVAAYRIFPTVEARSNLLDTLSDPLATRRMIGGAFEVAAAPSGTVAAVRGERRIDLYRVEAHGLGDRIGGADIDPGPLPGSGLSFTPDGATLLIGTGRGVLTVDVRDAAAPKPGGIVDVGRPVVRLSVAGDGRTMLASRADAPPVLVQRDGRTVPFPDDGYAETQAAVALSADARLAAVSAPGRGIELWDVSGPVPARRGNLPLSGASNQAVRMAFHGSALAAGLRSREAVVVDTADPAAPVLRRTVSGFTSYVNDVELSPDGARLVAASSDGQVRVVPLAGDDPELVFTGPEPIGVATVAGDTVLAAADGGVLRSWPLRTAAVTLGSRGVFQIPVHGSEVLVANGGPDSAVGQWRTGSGPELLRSGPDLAAPSGDLFSGALAVTGDGEAALGTASGRVYLADLRDRAHPRLSATGAPALGSIVETVAVSPDGRTALVGGLSTSQVAVLDTTDRATPRVVGRLDVTNGVPSVGFLDDRTAVLGTAGGDLVRVDLREPAAPRVVRTTHVFEASVAALAVAPDGRTLLLAASGGGHLAQVKVSVDGDPRITRFGGPSGSVNGAAFSPDGTRLVVASSSGEARLFHLSDGAAPAREASLTVDGAILYDARFTGDGSMIVASGNSGRLRTWDLDPQHVIDTVCSSHSAPITTEEWDRLAPGEPYFQPCG